MTSGSPYFQVVTWFLIILGWIIVNHQNNKREARKELRALLDKILEELSELEVVAFEFHRNAFDDVKSNNILHRLNRIAFQIHTSDLIDGRENSDFVDLRQAITLQNFDFSSHEALQITDPILQEIVASEQNLIQTLETAFLEKYPR